MPVQTFEAVIDENGVLRFTEPRRFPQGTKAIVTIVETEDAAAEQAEQAEFDIVLPPHTGDIHLRSPRILWHGETRPQITYVGDAPDIAPGRVTQYADIVKQPVRLENPQRLMPLAVESGEGRQHDAAI